MSMHPLALNFTAWVNVLGKYHIFYEGQDFIELIKPDDLLPYPIQPDSVAKGLS